jgi:hypothetical protein
MEARLKPIQLTEAQKTLQAAANYIEQHGWCQNAAETEAGVCALHAIFLCGGRAPFHAERTLEQRLGRSIVYWNDDPARTKEEVIAELRRID